MRLRDDVKPLADLRTLVVECSDKIIRGIVPTYGAALPGELIALFDSQGRLEIAEVGGSAAKSVQTGVSARVTVQNA